MTPLLRLRGLGIRYPGGVEALAGLDLDLAPGDRLAVLGGSGSGKSSLALAVAGLLPPGTAVAGSIEWPALGRAPLPGRDWGFVFQDAGASLDPVQRVGDAIAEVLRAHLPLPRAAAAARAAELLAEVGLPGAGRAFPHRLSGGQRQRVGIALAIAAGPALLIADEPTSALDALTQARIAELLARLVAAHGMTLLFITHDIALAASLADRIAVLDRGRLVEAGPAGRLLARPAHPVTRALRAAHLGLGTAEAGPGAEAEARA